MKKGILLIFITVVAISCTKKEVPHINALGISMDTTIDGFVNHLVDSLHFSLDSAISLQEGRLHTTLYGGVVEVDGVEVERNISISASPKSRRVHLILFELSPLPTTNKEDLTKLYYKLVDIRKAEVGFRPQGSTIIDYSSKNYNNYIYNPDSYISMWIFGGGMILQTMGESVITVMYSDEANRKCWCLENGMTYKKINHAEFAMALGI